MLRYYIEVLVKTINNKSLKYNVDIVCSFYQIPALHTDHEKSLWIYRALEKVADQRF